MQKLPRTLDLGRREARAFTKGVRLVRAGNDVKPSSNTALPFPWLLLTLRIHRATAY